MPKEPDPEPSVKMLEVFRFIVRFVEQNGYQPSQSEIGAKFGITKNAVTERLKGLEKRGFVTLGKGDRERAVTLHYVKFRAIHIQRQS